MGIAMNGFYNLVLNSSKKFFIGLGICLLLVNTVNGQDYKLQYKTALALFSKEKYAESLDAFQELEIYDKNNPYSEHASFYKGLSAQRLGYTLLAKQTYLQIEKLYASWANIDEVHYQLACIYFRQGDFFLAVKELNVIKNAVLQNESQKTKQYFITALTDVEILKLLLEEFPTDKIIALQLTTAIINNGSEAIYRPLLDSVIQKFKLNVQGYQANEPVKLVKKSFRISLLFPFLVSTLDPSPQKKKNQFVIDFYQGMQLASDSLARIGIKLEIVAYDTKRNLDTLRKILKYDELKSSDVLIGPLFADEFKIVSEFSEKQKIPMINPVTNNQEFLGSNKYALLFQPTFSTFGKKAAEFVASFNSKKPCIVYYEDTQKDSLMANAFVVRAKELGTPIALFEAVNKETAPKILSALATPSAYDKWYKPTEFTKKKKSIGCLFVASDNPLIFSKAINAVEARGDSILIIGNESWIKDYSVDLNIYERLSVIFMATNYTSDSNPAYIDFRRKFLAWHGNFPNTYDNYAKIGFEFTWFLGQNLKLYGNDLLKNLKSTDNVEGIFATNYSFKNANNNQSVSFIQFKEGALQLVEIK